MSKTIPLWECQVNWDDTDNYTDANVIPLVAKQQVGLMRYLETLRENKDLILAVYPRPESTGRRQRGYWFGVVMPILVMEMGWEEKEIEDFLLAEFSRDHITGKVIRISGMNKAWMSKFIERVIRWAATENGIYIPSSRKVRPGKQGIL